MLSGHFPHPIVKGPSLLTLGHIGQVPYLVWLITEKLRPNHVHGKKISGGGEYVALSGFSVYGSILKGVDAIGQSEHGRQLRQLGDVVVEISGAIDIVTGLSGAEAQQPLQILGPQAHLGLGLGLEDRKIDYVIAGKGVNADSRAKPSPESIFSNGRSNDSGILCHSVFRACQSAGEKASATVPQSLGLEVTGPSPIVISSMPFSLRRTTTSSITLEVVTTPHIIFSRERSQRDVGLIKTFARGGS